MIKLLPKLESGSFIFCSLKTPLPDDVIPVSTFREKEGITYLIKMEEAVQLNIKYEQEWSWISLGYQSALDMVGLTAAVSSALTEHGISCNIIAAYHHDHIFVPLDRAEEAIRILDKIII